MSQSHLLANATIDRMGWTGAEAWIFLSIGDAARTAPATLDKVIGMADSNNHSIPNVDEFENAVSQLLGAGYVTAAGGLYGLTKSGRGLYDKINSRKRGHITRFVETAELWRCLLYTSPSPRD